MDHSAPEAAARAGGFVQRFRNDLSSVFSIDFRSLALFRISLALIVFAEVCDRAVCFKAQYSDSGLLPGGVVRDVMEARPSLLLLSDSDVFAAAIFVATAIASVLMMIGWRTRLATIVTFVLLFSIQTRNPVLNHNGDVLMRLLLMWGMFLPLGSYLSLDALRGRSRCSKTSVCSVASNDWNATASQRLRVDHVVCVDVDRARFEPAQDALGFGAVGREHAVA